MLLAGVFGTFAICAGLLIYGSGRGFDLTDESFYLIWIRDPHAYEIMYQPFGYLLHPLFQLVGEDLQSFRLAGFAIAALAGAFLGHSLARGREHQLIATLYGAAAALTTFFPWIITPSYNSTADVAAMLIIGGVLNSLQERRLALAIGAVGSGAGMCLAAFTKPPLFALSFLLILAMAVVLKRRARHLAALVLALVLISLVLSPAEMPALIRRIIVSQHVLALPNTPSRLPAKALRDWFAVPAPLSLGAATILLSLALRQTRWSAGFGYAAAALGIFYLASVASDAADPSIPDFVGLALVMFAAGYACILQHEQRPQWIAIALLIAAPAAVALGTFNNQWSQLNLSLPFPFVATFALACSDPAAWRRRSAFAFAIAGPIAAMLLAAWAPYSLPAPIFQQQVAVHPPIGSGTVLVDEETAGFIAEASGLARGALVIDLSGTGPGVVVVLGGHAPVLPWLNPATGSWPDVVWSRLDSRQQRDAWFVVPVWQQFIGSGPARWVTDHKSQFCSAALPEMPFWDQERTLQLWRPCAGPPRDSSS